MMAKACWAQLRKGDLRIECPRTQRSIETVTQPVPQRSEPASMNPKTCHPKHFYGKNKKNKKKEKKGNSKTFTTKCPTFSEYNEIEDIYDAEKVGASRYPLVIEFRGLFPGQLKDRDTFIDVSENRLARLGPHLKHVFIWGLHSKSSSARRTLLTKIVRSVSGFTKLVIVLPQDHTGHLKYSIKGKICNTLKV